MKRLFLSFMSLMLIICLAGCDINNDDLTKKQIIDLLKNEYDNEYDNDNETYIYLDYSLEEKIPLIKEKKKNLYLIDYNYKDRYYCGYISETINKQIEGKRWIIFDEDHVLNSFKNLLYNNEISFKFEDIKWIEYNDANDILYQNENYYLKFIFKINEVTFIEDIYENIINQIIPDFIHICFSIQENKVVLLEYELEYEQLEAGKYFLYGNNTDNFENITFNKFLPKKFRPIKFSQDIVQKINDENLIKDYVGWNGKDSNFNLFDIKYGIYKINFESKILKEEVVDDATLAYWEYEDYKNLFIEILNE
jgi:hypothetical protein